MKLSTSTLCPVCQKARGAGNHAACSRKMQLLKSGESKRVTTPRMTDKAVGYLAHTGVPT